MPIPSLAQLLLYLGAAMSFGWGVSHAFPTRDVVRGFGDIGDDNRRIIAMEWVNESATLIFVGTLVAVVTSIDHEARVSTAVYLLAFLMLNSLSVISLFTGFRINFLPFRLCPIIFTGSSLLILAGALL